jgi:acetyl esterase/lipase
VPVKLDVWPEMFHVFQMWGFLPEAKKANRKIGEFIRNNIAR